MTPGIVLNQVSKGYDNHLIFSQLKFEFSSGAYSLEGQNGVGKSTLIRLISGIETADSGDIYVNGLSVKKDRVAVNRQRTYLPDTPAFYENSKVKEILIALFAIRGVSSAVGRDLMNYWDIHPLLDRKWKELSLGQRKRVFYGITLLGSVPVWILDEPSNGIDQEWLPKVASTISKHAKDGLVVFSSHDKALLNLVQPTSVYLERNHGHTEVFI